jgi:hypothetical protein
VKVPEASLLAPGNGCRVAASLVTVAAADRSVGGGDGVRRAAGDRPGVGGRSDAVVVAATDRAVVAAGGVSAAAGDGGDAYWCCTMRGGDGLAYCAENQILRDGNTFEILYYNDGLYKFGETESKVHTQQVQQYMSLIRQMGYQVTGFLCYVSIAKVIEVELS